MSFANLYYKRTAATPKACYVCYKPTQTVLATINTTDFLYTCTVHLTDPGFASPVAESTMPATAVSAEEITKVKQEWEAKQKEKKEKQAKEAKKDAPDKGKKDKDQPSDKAPSTSPPPSSQPATPAAPTHQRFTLHRDFFTMRQAEHRRRRQAVQVKDLAPRLPQTPYGGV
ncbi:DUF1742-domain-containing protein [Fistulina hepatica ATCC 64428]|uniref:DUF1742-domain-containing protein n=1 Tax=Fistulina hepatica ATCC 64428 TaxID=1128425 RepID=A0A0D7A4Y2_9AGAR|nr:DUF1742-domain-containing protein [Fistulina hepatica ATCC 64428]